MKERRVIWDVERPWRHDVMCDCPGCDPHGYEEDIKSGAICPDCLNLSPTEEEIHRQVATTGDTSGACGTCHNKHRVESRGRVGG